MYYNKPTILLLVVAGFALAGCNRTSDTETAKTAGTQPADSKQPVDYGRDHAARRRAADPAPGALASQTPPATSALPQPMTDSMATGSGTPHMATNSSEATKPGAIRAMHSAPYASPSAARTAENTARPAGDPNQETPALGHTQDGQSNPAVITRRLAEWKLTANEIKQEFESSGRIERSRTIGAGEPTGPMDGMLVSLVSSRLKTETELAALNLDISAASGVVTLDGSAKSLDQIGKAVAIALDTKGVSQAISTIKLNPAL